MKRKPKLHVSIYYQGNPETKILLQKKLSDYSKRLLTDPCSPIVDLRLDTLDEQDEKLVLMELSYYEVHIYELSKQLKNANQLYTVVAALVALNIQRLYEKNPNTGVENWLLISIFPTIDYNDMYNIKWSSGYYCCRATHHSVKFANDD